MAERVEKASFVIWFLRYWRAWVRTSTDIAIRLDTAFLSNQAYRDITLSCHSFIILARIQRDFFPKAPFCPWWMGTDCVESFFSELGSMVRNKRVYTFGEALWSASRCHTVEAISARANVNVRQHNLRLDATWVEDDGQTYDNDRVAGGWASDGVMSTRWVAGQSRARSLMLSLGVGASMGWFETAAESTFAEDTKYLRSISKRYRTIISRHEEGELEEDEEVRALDREDDQELEEFGAIHHVAVQLQPRGRNNCGAHCLSNLSDLFAGGSEVDMNKVDVDSRYLETQLQTFPEATRGRVRVLEARAMLDLWETRATLDDIFALFVSSTSEKICFICNTVSGEALDRAGTVAHWVLATLRHSARGGLIVEIRDSKPSNPPAASVCQLAETLIQCGRAVTEVGPDTRELLARIEAPGEGGEQPVSRYLEVPGEGPVHKARLFRRLQDKDCLTADRMQRQRQTSIRQGDLRHLRDSKWLVDRGDNIAVQYFDPDVGKDVVWLGRVTRILIKKDKRKQTKEPKKRTTHKLTGYRELRRKVDVHAERESAIVFDCIWYTEKGTFESPTWRWDVVAADLAEMRMVIMPVDLLWNSHKKWYTMPSEQWEIIQQSLLGVDFLDEAIAAIHQP